MASGEERDEVRNQPLPSTDSVPAAEPGGAGGSTTQDYGGMAQDVKNVDTEGAAGVGADPPGGLPIDFGDNAPEDQHDTTSTS